MNVGRKLAVIALAATALSGTAIAQSAVGTPQRGSTTPPGLAKLLQLNNPGILRAIVATVGSNSRLQDLPDSP